MVARIPLQDEILRLMIGYIGRENTRHRKYILRVHAVLADADQPSAGSGRQPAAFAAISPMQAAVPGSALPWGLLAAQLLSESLWPKHLGYLRWELLAPGSQK